MDDEVYKVSSLSGYLTIIEDKISAIHPEFSERTLRKKANKAFKEFSKEEFVIVKNTHMQKFYVDGVIGEERSCRSKTYILKDDKHDILGMFTIRLDAIDISKLNVDLKESIILNGKNPAKTSIVPCCLIEEIAKNFKYTDNPISLEDLVRNALNKIKQVQSVIGGDLVTLNSVCVDKVMKKYHDIGFQNFASKYTPNGSVVSYQPMYVRMSSI